MGKEFINYEMALSLKELGFDEPCYDNYNIYGKLWGLRLNKQVKIKDACLAPTFSQAFRWFREKYNFHSNIKCVNTMYNNHFRFEIDSNGETLACTNKIKSYEKAELGCLQKLIEITKNK